MDQVRYLMNKIFIAIQLIITNLTIIGCVEVLPSESNNPGFVVVNCLLNDNDVQFLSLSRSTKVEDEANLTPVTDAKAYLYDISGGKFIIGPFVHNKEGVYSINYRPIPGKTYLLEIITHDGAEILARTEMPVIQPFLPLSPNKIYLSMRNQTKDGFIPDIISVPTTQDLSSAYFFFMGLNYTLSNMVLTTRLTSNFINDEALTNIPKDYQISPILNIHRNLEFSQKDPISDFNKLAPGDNNDTRYWLYFKVTNSVIALNNGNRLVVHLNIDTTLMNAFCFKTLSDEYNSYITSVMEKAWTFQDPSGLSSMFDITNVYTNISGGFGVFGAYSDIYFFYKGSQFVNFHIAQTQETISREMITSYMLSINWNDIHDVTYTPSIKRYIEWLRLNQ